VGHPCPDDDVVTAFVDTGPVRQRPQMDDIVEPSAGLQGRHEVYSATHIGGCAFASRVERYSVNRGLWTVKMKRMNAMPGSLGDEHHLIPDPWKCGLLFRCGFCSSLCSSFFPSSPHKFMRGINERVRETKSADIEIVRLSSPGSKKQA